MEASNSGGSDMWPASITLYRGLKYPKWCRMSGSLRLCEFPSCFFSDRPQLIPEATWHQPLKPGFNHSPLRPVAKARRHFAGPVRGAAGAPRLQRRGPGPGRGLLPVAGLRSLRAWPAGSAAVPDLRHLEPGLVWRWRWRNDYDLWWSKWKNDAVDGFIWIIFPALEGLSSQLQRWQTFQPPKMKQFRRMEIQSFSPFYRRKSEDISLGQRPLQSLRNHNGKHLLLIWAQTLVSLMWNWCTRKQTPKWSPREQNKAPEDRKVVVISSRSHLKSQYQCSTEELQVWSC